MPKMHARNRVMPILANPRHEAVARAIAAGVEQTAAYQSVYTTAQRKGAQVSASSLLSQPLMRARVAELQAASATSLTLSMQERREMLADCARHTEMAPRDLATVLRVDAELAGDLIARAEVKDTTPREPLEAVRARIAAALATHGRS